MTDPVRVMPVSPKETVQEIRPARAKSGGVRWLWKKPATLMSALFILLLICVAALAPVISPYEPDAQNLVDRLAPPSPEHWLGTDEYGRDALSRLIFGARVSLVAALQAVSITLILGLPAGIIAGYVGGWFDTVMNRIMDVLMSVPSLVLALTIVAVLGPGITEAMLAVGIVLTPRTFRVARASTLEVRNDTYIEAARAVGASTGRIIVRNVLPNVTPPIILVSAVSLGTAVSAEASLSFLGLGVRPPTASWGSMLDNAASTMGIAPLHVWPPGIAIFLTVLAFTYLGEGMRAALIRTRSNGVES
ncbi:ABC transporter permease [Arthrobacter sp. zg-Y820]|uniref:ABC transporter permease n=1 Tax=unclassified Arthrobacter TaxID=235627 RepID=UPI001E3A6DCB|nr:MULTISPECIES: ABC transporter permease [unclassified Arthrobacter]MCC9196806.1 ABC transporter permease [Arthrobacter sp. zg-Y820]MDK1279668.1 ABC transporter permease [Arthrobacter sp. zg.Y820]WIB07962.1 ABC transporter permease [Arthrobacter sp. zg-Y820]